MVHHFDPSDFEAGWKQVTETQPLPPPPPPPLTTDDSIATSSSSSSESVLLLQKTSTASTTSSSPSPTCLLAEMTASTEHLTTNGN
uniref:Uncharacterized protein n=1 Tax=Caenorhabditis japonica TaxID=281687 RepID=A0A8R1EVF1_CAEJA